MGQKASPIAFRLALTKKWLSNWYANKQDFGRLVIQDKEIRDYLMKKSSMQGTSKIFIRRMSGKVEITILTARPGLVIGKKGGEIDVLRKELSDKFRLEFWVEVEEIKRPDIDAQLVADGVAKQLARRMPFRRVMKKAMQAAMESGAAGIKVAISGRIGGAEIARMEWYKEGSVPLQTLRADIDYAHGRAETTYGSIGVKVWIMKGEA